MGKRLQFPLYKLFVVTAVYAVALGLSSRFGGWWQPHCVALMVGTAINVLVFIGTRGNLYRTLETSFCVLFGTYCSINMLAHELTGFRIDPQDDCPSNIVTRNALLIAALIGIIGGAGASVALQRLRKSAAVSIEDSTPESDQTG